MANKKKAAKQQDGTDEGSRPSTTTAPPHPPIATQDAVRSPLVPADTTPSGPTKATPDSSCPDRLKAVPFEPDVHSTQLIIARNKHWRYISAFHGPWLQLPLEILESLANANYYSPRPRPIDPAVFYDLVKIRRAVDDATNLAVRAASGVASPPSAYNGRWSSSSNAAAQALGLGYWSAGGGPSGGPSMGAGGSAGGAGGGAKLSRERKLRMRELAAQKLSTAYHVDEVIASVATMQGASALEDVAALVLQRSGSGSSDSSVRDARYVHFFHEKIPSRMTAQCTPLTSLNDLIADRPGDPAPYRTRALTRIFKGDYAGAAKDLTDGLAACRYLASQQHNNIKTPAETGQLVLARYKGDHDPFYAWKFHQDDSGPIPDEKQPTSMEAQMLFQRGNVYLNMACEHVHASLDGPHEEQSSQQEDQMTDSVSGHPPMTASAREAGHVKLEARKAVKMNARRAVRDYMAFLSHLDYSPGQPEEVIKTFLRQVHEIAVAGAMSSAPNDKKVKAPLPPHNGTTSSSAGALVTHHKNDLDSIMRDEKLKLPPAVVHDVSALFAPSPPPNLPDRPTSRLATASITASTHSSSSPPSPAVGANELAFPNHPTPLFDPAHQSGQQHERQQRQPPLPPWVHESVTYHPLLTDALHALLLAHCLLQTSLAELRRHALNAARCARLVDGYPAFVEARSGARADWVDVLRRAGDFLGLERRWDDLCRPEGAEKDKGQGEERAGTRGAARGQRHRDDGAAEVRARRERRRGCRGRGLSGLVGAGARGGALGGAGAAGGRRGRGGEEEGEEEEEEGRCGGGGPR
ncbi:hypothetical protein BDY21DRAFT_409936 [Lineolata rhizophorae]|uniref:Histidine kinase group protein n=1 Tax=Lineolata rhizophorae TaxID=578093 RepID=A0A6A6P4Q9_9PEZI|nr:hypothetical protein BDY21DRAFT_409936 [Lineolata rhizophorae]